MKTFYTLILFIFFICARAQVNSFSFNINGTPPAGMAAALNVAGQKWSTYLQITTPVKVNVFTVNSGLLPFSAITLGNGRQNFVNAPVANILYPTSLANQIAGAQTNSGEFDMDIYFNLASGYYFGTGKPAANETDFISTAMHEIGHGLGFYSDGYVSGSGIGSFGNIPPSALYFLPSSFPWRGQDGVPTIFDKHIVKSSNNNLVGLAPDNSAALGDTIKNGSMYFNGPLYANATHSNTPVRLSGGSGTFTLGVDLLHIHNTYANTIMSYYWGDGDTVRIPAPWELGILKEIGWNLKPIGIKENKDVNIASVYPSPANETIYINAKNMSEVNLFNVQGEIILTKQNYLKEENLEINLKNLNEGNYFLSIRLSDTALPVTRKIVVHR